MTFTLCRCAGVGHRCRTVHVEVEEQHEAVSSPALFARGTERGLSGLAMAFDPTGPSLAYSKFSAQHLPHSEYLTKIRSYYSLDTKQSKLSLPPQWQSKSDKRTENRISNSQLSVSALGGGLPGSKVHSHMKTWFCLFVFLCGAGDRTQGLTNIRQSICRTTPPSQMCFIQNAQCWNIIEI